MPGACGLRPCAQTHHKKGLVPHLPVGWGGQQIPQITISLTPLQVSGSTSAGRVICGTDLAECVSVPGDLLRPQRAFPPGFYPFGGWVHCPASLIRGMPTGPWAFLGMPGACGLRPYARTHLKKALCHTCPLGGASNKYRRSISVLSEQYETSYLFYVTLSFLCSIIGYLIPVFVFPLVTLSAAATLIHSYYNPGVPQVVS